MRHAYEKIFVDAAGERFHIRKDEAGFSVWHRKMRVGHLYVNEYGSTIELADLLIRDDLICESRSFWKRLLGKPDRLSYRNKRLGSALLQALIEYAKTTGAARIEGRIVKLDSEPQAWLMDWYRKRGFTVEETPASGSGEAKIFLALKGA